jgi:hypothetical protein
MGPFARRALGLVVVTVGLSLPTVAQAKRDDDDGAKKAKRSSRASDPKFGRKGKGFGLGVSAGDPMGLSVKYFFTPAHAISGHVAWGPLHNGDGLVELDYHWHSRVIGSSPIVDAHFYVGGGVGLGFWARDSRLNPDEDRRNAGAALLLRAPAIGLAYHWSKVPLDTALELAWSPYIILPALRHLDASIKVRYFF